MRFPSFPVVTVPKAALRRLLPLTVLTGLSVAVAVVSYVYGLKPAEARLDAIERAYHSAKQVQTALQQTRAQQVQVRAAQRQLETERAALPTRAEFSSLALAVSELAKREQVTIPGMSYDMQKKDGPQLVKATMAFRATGDYAAIYRFVHRLETAERYLVIESLDVAGEHMRETAATRVVVNITVTTYLRHEAV
ncbi:MAG: type 4a pilus biogenesis protein PilO [Nitrospira sp.]|nr:type 4a pilus biogenesis protein PilO [Nitrospira sp.]MBS0167414.1 type 4a pilus biogenesis protein PilO [Nitrospira sp.]